MTVEANLIAEFVADIWRVVVGRSPEPAADSPTPAADWLTGWVQITGAWRGTVSVSGPPAVMTSLAAAVLGVPAERVKDAERADAVGELAAMLAGNLKAILPPPCYLSRPAVATADSEPEDVVRRRVLKGGFLDPAGPFVVTVTETSRSGARRRTPERPSGVSPLSDCEASGRFPRVIVQTDGAV
jgi:chemotaxis protein CheX